MVIIYTNGGALRLVPTSCAKDEEVAKATDGGKVPVRLTLAFSNFGGRAASEPGDLDYTTVEQSAMTADDVYVLVVDAMITFCIKYRI